MPDLEYLSDLRAELAHVAQRSEHETSTRPSWWRLRTGLVALTAAVGCLALGTTIGVQVFEAGSTTTETQANPQTERPGVRGLLVPFTVAHPLFKSHRTSPSKAASALGIRRLPLPSNESIDSSPAGTISAYGGQHASKGSPVIVAVSYPRAKLVVEYESPIPYRNPLASYKAYVAQTPTNLAHLASIGSVTGSPALFLQLHQDASRSNPASIEFVHSGLRVAIIGFRPLNELLPIAVSIAARSVSAPA